MPEGIIINPFDTSGYDMATMTEAVNLIDNNYGRVRSLGIFQPDPVTTRTVLVEEVNGNLTLLKSQPLGSPAPYQKNPKAKLRSFVIPYIPYTDRILPEDIQGRRQAGTVEPATLAAIMERKLTGMRGSHAITEEHLMMGALKGIILDADGSTLYNLFTEFGINQKTVDFALDNDATDVAAKCREVVRHMEDNLKGDVMDHVHCTCSEGFFDDLIGHPNVEKFWINHVTALQLAGVGTDPRKGFIFGSITFEEYRGTATDPASGNARPFIAADEAHFFPIGSQNSFKIHYAPANYMETVNTMGMPIYAKQTMDAKGRWIDIDMESNPLPLCRRPALLVKGTV